MPRVVFKPTIPVFERAMTIHVLDRTATVIGKANTIKKHYTGMTNTDLPAIMNREWTKILM
jgi:shikimate 5-dehydrogenase